MDRKVLLLAPQLCYTRAILSSVECEPHCKNSRCKTVNEKQKVNSLVTHCYDSCAVFKLFYQCEDESVIFNDFHVDLTSSADTTLWNVRGTSTI